LHVIITLTFNHRESKAVAAIGGVEEVVKAMKTFPDCKHYRSLYVSSELGMLRIARRKSSKRVNRGSALLL
jgi:hypothetical protein